jgi:hypothetical protein
MWSSEWKARAAFGRGRLGLARIASVALVWSFGCSSDDAGSPEPQPDPADPASPGGDPASGAEPPLIYDPAHVLEVSVELDPADWDVLRGEGRSLFDVFQGNSLDYEYSEFMASASVDGERHEGASVSKKGFLGSLSRIKPSLKLDFGPAPDGSARDFRRLTLNNDRQDPTHARQCLAYGLFAKAGLPAPACNLAHVTVNGQDLGTFTNVEPIKKPFLARHFTSDEGNLYEGQTVDFVGDDLDAFQLKTNELESDRSDLGALVEALEADDAELVTRVGSSIDLDQYRDFWALETLAGHWDGYDGNANNYYVYRDPESQRFHFIPWGTDGSFAESSPGDTLNTTRTVYARGRIANRLYRLADERERFRARLGELIDIVWDESALVDELERLTERAPDALPAATAELRRYLQTHAGEVRVELDQPAPEWVDAPDTPSPCSGTLGDVSMEFDTSYGDLAAIDPTSGSFAVGLGMDGAPFEGAWFGRAGVDATSIDPSILLRAVSLLPGGGLVLLQLALPPAEFAAGSRSLYALESYGLVLILAGAETRFVGFVSDGTLELDEAEAMEGAPVRGRLSARLLQLACAEL